MTPIDFSFRPAGYWSPSDVRRALLTNMKGEARRRIVSRAAATGALDDIPHGLTAAVVSEEERTALSRLHPSLMGGEYLPDYALEEVEIARIVLDSTTQDVISIRASRQGGDIVYRVVDEYDTPFRVRQARSKTPLALHELVRLMDSAKIGDDGRNLVRYYQHVNIENARDAAQREELSGFVTVRSDFYKQLGRYYRGVIKTWVNTGRWTPTPRRPDTA